MKVFLKLTAGAALLCSAAATAAEPAGYYNSCDNKCGSELLTALLGTVGNPEVVGYSGLWELYKLSDTDANGKIWDMYSTKRWEPGKEQCGNYSSVGDCYNREHSVPKSWFNDALPMYADAFHIYPTDGKVNGQRSNYPFGECAEGTRLKDNNGIHALGKLGACTYPGYSGTVFEPDDEYKGDFARSYFYMAAAYNDRISSWNSDMFDGSSYPAFTGWATEMLLAWSRKDPVSDKETQRNEIVYAHQGNRNPFIDHPELAEHIWGKDKSTPWKQETRVEVAINRPVDGSSLSLGYAAAGIEVVTALEIRTTGADSPVKLTASYPFYVTPAQVDASEANKGTTVQLSLNSPVTGRFDGKLTAICGSARSEVTLSGEVVDGIPANAATDTDENSFTANWIYVGDDTDGTYSITVSDANGVLEDYPAAVDARAGKYRVAGLEPSTAYSYNLSGKTLTSNTVKVRTTGILPFIDFLFDGRLDFRTQPGTASAAAEIILYSENIGDNEIAISVEAPFELSTDRSEWSGLLRMSPDESRFYLRLGAAAEGSYECALVAEAGSYRTDAATIHGEVAGRPFMEDFEAEPDDNNGYVDIYKGTACTWLIKEGGFWTSDPVFEGQRSLRFSKKSESFVAMNEDRAQGIGTVSFYAAKWNNDREADATIVLETSTDGGATWQEAGSVVISDKSFRQYSFTPGVEGSARMRLRQTAGARWLVDNIAITDAQTGVSDPGALRHQWDAYSLGGKLVVDVRRDIDAAIYCIDGTTLHSGHLTAGRHTFEARPGQFYIVVADSFSRTVLIRK